MIFVPVIWVSFDFRPCKKKSLKNIPVKKNCLKKVPGPTFLMIWHGVCHVACHVILNFYFFLKFWKLFLKLKNMKINY